MLYANKKREDLENSNKLVSLENQVNAVRLQEKLGKQNLQELMKKVFEPMTEIAKDVSKGISKTITETSIKNNKAFSDLNEKVSELMNVKGMIAPYLASSLVNLFKPENKSQLKLKKDFQLG